MQKPFYTGVGLGCGTFLGAVSHSSYFGYWCLAGGTGWSETSTGEPMRDHFLSLHSLQVCWTFPILPAFLLLWQMLTPFPLEMHCLNTSQDVFKLHSFSFSSKGVQVHFWLALKIICNALFRQVLKGTVGGLETEIYGHSLLYSVGKLSIAGEAAGRGMPNLPVPACLWCLQC